MDPQIFKITDSLWLLNDGKHLIICDPPGGAGHGFIGFIALEEATIFLTDSNWDQTLLATKIPMEQLWAVETLPIYVFTPEGRGRVSMQTLQYKGGHLWQN